MRAPDVGLGVLTDIVRWPTGSAPEDEAERRSPSVSLAGSADETAIQRSAPRASIAGGPAGGRPRSNISRPGSEDDAVERRSSAARLVRDQQFFFMRRVSATGSSISTGPLLSGACRDRRYADSQRRRRPSPQEAWFSRPAEELGRPPRREARITRLEVGTCPTRQGDRGGYVFGTEVPTSVILRLQRRDGSGFEPVPSRRTPVPPGEA